MAESVRDGALHVTEPCVGDRALHVTEPSWSSRKQNLIVLQRPTNNERLVCLHCIGITWFDTATRQHLRQIRQEIIVHMHGTNIKYVDKHASRLATKRLREVRLSAMAVAEATTLNTLYSMIPERYALLV